MALNKAANLKIDQIQVNGLNVDGAEKTIGDMEKAINVDILADRTMKLRPDIIALHPPIPTIAGWGITNIFELRREDGTKKVYVDTRYDDSGTYGKVLGNTNDTTGTNIDLGTSWSNLKDGLSVDNAYKPWWANASDSAFRFDGLNNNFFFKDADCHNVGLTPPASAPSVAATTGGSMEQSATARRVYYIYKVDEAADNRLTRSDPSALADVVVNTPNNAINVDVVASSDTDVNYIEIYVNASGSYDYFYLSKTVANTTATVKIIKADADIIGERTLDFDNAKPYKAKFGRAAGGRMFYANHPGEEDSGGRSWLTWSKISEFEHWGGGLEPFAPKAGGQITGIAGPVQDNLMIFKRNRTWLFNVTNLTSMDLFANDGCVAPYSIQEMGAEGGVIWLSAEGVQIYNGGEKKNITKNRINGIVRPYIDADGSSDYINSNYYPSSRQYHLLLTSRDSSLIDTQRHLVYHLDSDTWTEYSYKTDDGIQLYETAVGTLTDANGKDVLVSPCIDGTDATLANLYQLGGTPYASFPVEILDSAGADSTAPRNSYCAAVCDDDMNIFVAEGGGGTDGIRMFQVNKTGIASYLGLAVHTQATVDAINTIDLIIGNDNRYLYVSGEGDYGATQEIDIIRMDKAGTDTIIDNRETAQGYNPGGLVMDSEGSLFYACVDADWGMGSPVHKTYIYKITTPEGTPSASLYYTFTYGYVQSMKMIGDDIYIAYNYDAGDDGTNLTSMVGKLNNVTGSADFEDLFEGPANTHSNLEDQWWSFQPMTSSKIYYTTDWSGSNEGTLYMAVLYGGTWIKTLVNDDYDFADLGIDTQGNLIALSSLIDTGVEKVWKYFEAITIDDEETNAWDEVMNESGDGTNPCNSMVGGVWTSSVQSTNMGHPIIIGINSENVYLASPVSDGENYKSYIIDQFISNFEENAEMALYGTIAEIVFYMEPNYLHKRLRRFSFITDNQYPVGGLVAAIPDSNISDAAHTDGESSVPSRSICRTAFVAGGEQSWQTYNYFSDNNERVKHTCNLYGKGYGFRVYLTLGSLIGAQRGSVKIAAPTLFYQELGTR